MWLKAGLFGAVMLAVGIVLGYVAAAFVVPRISTTPPSVVPSEPAWQFIESSDAMTDAKSYSAVWSDGDASAIVQCNPATKRFKLYFYVGPIHVDRAGQGLRTMYRFDEEPAIEALWFSAVDDRSVFPELADQFAIQMQKAQLLRLRVEDGNGQLVDGTISLKGSAEPIVKVLQKCS